MYPVLLVVGLFASPFIIKTLKSHFKMDSESLITIIANNNLDFSFQPQIVFLYHVSLIIVIKKPDTGQSREFATISSIRGGAP